MMGLDRHQPYTRTEGLPHRTLGDETVVLNVQTREVHVLNGTGSLIWSLLDSAHSLTQLMVVLAKDFALDPSAAEPQVAAFLADLLDKGLVTAPTGGGA